MPLGLSIQPFADVLDMYGDGNLSSAFSLSGHVSVSLTSLSSLFARRRASTRILLQSLSITFDGQSEVLSPGTGYSPIRLCSITRELLPGDPVELSNEGHEDSDTPCLWNVVFDIPVPGWLPTTSVYGDASLQATGTSYALYATATFVDISHGRSSFIFASICGSACSRTHTVDASRCPITLRRLVEPQLRPPSSRFQMSAHTVKAHRVLDSDGSFRGSSPIDVSEKIQVIASIPGAIAMDETSFPFILHVRGRDLNDSDRMRLKITEFSVDIKQVEVYRNSSSQDDVDHPIPSHSHQPPCLPLRDPHPIRSLYDIGFLGTFRQRVKRTFSLFAPSESGRYVISGDGHIFASDRKSSPENNWHILKIVVPILAEPCLRDWAGDQKRRITESSPLFSVEHYMHVVICWAYDPVGSDEMVPERLHFSLPMKHVNVPEVTVPSSRVTLDGREVVRKYLPRSQALPAYSQLFHPNGEQKLDYSTPLPLYKPPSPSFGLGSDQQRSL